MTSYEHKVKNIYLGEPGWIPGENTVAYYKFDGNLNDSSGNSRNLSGGTFTYGTLQTGAKYIQTSSGQYTDNYTSMPFNSSSYTINMYVLFESMGSRQSCVIDFYTGLTDFPRIWFTNISTVELTANSSDVSITSGEWHNYCIVCNNNTVTGYVDGVQKVTKEINSFNGNLPYFRINSVGYVNGGYYNLFSGGNKSSELIIESKVRTAQEVENYYNQTKSNYGL